MCIIILIQNIPFLTLPALNKTIPHTPILRRLHNAPLSSGMQNLTLITHYTIPSSLYITSRHYYLNFLTLPFLKVVIFGALLTFLRHILNKTILHCLRYSKRGALTCSLIHKIPITTHYAVSLGINHYTLL